MSKTKNDQADSGHVLLDRAALSNVLPKSSAESGAVDASAAHQWPRDCLDLAGRFTDFPMSQENPVSQQADLTRSV